MAAVNTSIAAQQMNTGMPGTKHSDTWALCGKSSCGRAVTLQENSPGLTEVIEHTHTRSHTYYVFVLCTLYVALTKYKNTVEVCIYIYIEEDTHVFKLVLCNTIDITRYRNTKVGIDTQTLGIEYAE